MQVHLKEKQVFAQMPPGHSTGKRIRSQKKRRNIAASTSV
jgi:hypothetical protein